MKYILTIVLFFAAISPAHADPFSALIGAIAAGVSALGTTLSGLVSFASLSAFLASPIGSLIIGIGLQLVSSLFIKKPQVPSVEAGKVNVRISEPERWMAAGQSLQGGGVLFAEFDADGNFWYLIVHSDSYHVGILKRFFDGIEIDIDVDGWVTTADFCLDDDDNLATEDTPLGDRRSFFQILTTTHTRLNPTPPQIAAFQAAFPGASGWTNDHKLVGSTYSVIKMKPLSVTHRYKLYKWRGAVGVGEPAVGLVANWSEPYDPRTETYATTKNPILIWAWFRTHPNGRNKPFTSINWDKVGEWATIADQNIVGIEGTQKMFEASISIPDSKERAVAEQEILIACDGQIVFDDNEKVWIRPGYYVVPTLTLSRNRDIFAMESVEAQNGESETHGVIVRYIDPAAGYTTQPSAAWKNPYYYDPAKPAKYLVIDALAIQNHNQAMRIAKAYGMRSQPPYKLLPTVGLRGLKARRERIVDLIYDNTFAGDHEIVTPVEVDQNGIFCGMGIVPVDANRWKLLAGEELPKPVAVQMSDTYTLPLPTSVVIAYTGAQLVATFDPPTRDDFRFEFQAKLTTSSKWMKFSVDMDELTAYLAGIKQLKFYDLRYRTLSSAGKSSGWFSPTDIFTSVLIISGTPITVATVGVAYTGFDVDVTGGDSPYYFADLYGRLPPGIVINNANGIVSGTPTVAGTYNNIRIRVSDNDGNFNYLPDFNIVVT